MTSPRTPARILVHVGLPKTATTLLQLRVLPSLGGWSFLDSHPGHQEPGFREALNSLMDDEEWDPEPLRARIHQLSVRHGRLIISLEHLSGRVWDGAMQRHRTCARLHVVAPESRILIVLRNQPRMLWSLYAEYIKEGGSRDLETFLAGDAPGSRLRLSAFEYTRIVESYVSAFGQDEVLVLPMEALAQDPEQFVTQIAAHAGVPDAAGMGALARLRENVTLSRPSFIATRWVNRGFRRSRFNPAPPFPIRGTWRVPVVLQRHVDPRLFAGRSLSPTTSEKRLIHTVCSVYARDNDRLVDMTGLDLNRFGYPLAFAKALEP